MSELEETKNELNKAMQALETRAQQIDELTQRLEQQTQNLVEPFAQARMDNALLRQQVEKLKRLLLASTELF